jgi:hypothetical protein
MAKAHLRTMRAVLVLAVVCLGLVAPRAVAWAQDPASAPITTLSNGGRTASDGARSLSVSQVSDLDPNGQTLAVSGAGFSPDKGVYVAFCVIPATNQTPTPCGGGMDLTAATGASLWISSNAPDYGDGLATAFGPGGTFSGTLTVTPRINDALDCRQLRCAIVTRADHTRTADRSLDLFVPVTFGTGPASGAPTTVPLPPPVPTTAVAVLDPAAVAPTASVTPNGLAVTDGVRTLSASRVADLDPNGAEVDVAGSGFDEARGVYVGLCAIPAADPTLAVGAAPKPGPCAAPAEGGSTWISSNPPDYGKGSAVAYTSGGGFAETLELRAVIDADHDCRVVACALVSRNDDANGADRTQDLYLPVSFAAESSADAGADGDLEVADAATDDGSSAALILGGGVAVVALAVGAFAVRRRRGATGDGADLT